MEIMNSDEEDEVMNIFDSLRSTYQNNLELMRGSEFVFDYVQLLYYKFHKIKLSCGGWYIDSPDCTKKSKSNNKASIKKIRNVFSML